MTMDARRPRPVTRLFATTLLAGALAAPLALPATDATAASLGWLQDADFADVAERVAPAVVQVIATHEPAATGPRMELPPELRDSPFGEFFRRFQPPGQPEARPRQGQGSGFVIDEEGFVVTNAHVVGEAASVRVVLADGRELDGSVVGRDTATDLALVKVEAEAPLPVAALGDSDALRVGEPVMAMGNPFGLGGSVTAGIVSARGRDIGAGPYDDFIQTDAPINPGSSGGPLVNAAGEVVGVNTAIFSPSGGNVGIGFAIPANLVKDIVADLRADGAVTRGWLGVSLQPLDDDLALALGVAADAGALVGSVEPDSPAAAAGVEPGDVIVAVDGTAIAGPRELASAIAAIDPGSETNLEVQRGGTTTSLAVEIGMHPASRPVAEAPSREPMRLGLALAARDGQGVTVEAVEPGSAAAARGVRPGDVILRAGDREVQAPGDVAEAVAAAEEAGREALALQIERAGRRSFLAVPLGAA
ncbi:MAG: Do family serine endopeptidase [Roseicyclus sp.]